MIKKNYNEIYNSMIPSISPMIASGRILKRLYSDSKVVFISPCVAKKSEAKESDLIGAIDSVITFRELKEIFDATGIVLEDLFDDEKDQASYGGRIYARTGGVSFSVKTVVNRLEPLRVVKLKPKRIDGIKACKNFLDEFSINNREQSNFIEGMGCVGGCVGGPKTNIDKTVSTNAVNSFGEDSNILTPFDNLNAIKILKQFGIDSLENLLENEEMKALLSR